MPAKKAAKKAAAVVDEGPQCEILRTDMDEEAAEAACAVFKEKVKEHKLEKDLAAAIKKHFDAENPNTTWHCIVGNHFGVSISHSTGFLIFASIDRTMTILLFKSQE
mmetsp:Transcript_17303/g.24250  ORF Transcript_17303/g.24250 Transcript_17303/m.24250 type:complete len:107 (-) Transcript_17303:342-662(-)|eukprot:CAMPEP_0175098758 /NCGR_PEP_ID=MMETSP0086_2-20121207/6046_1 /TAXON_ID=136419 /ORGANISM="Unknown Unknown, Strain D1" /LENGTH=106 /DNA_ID=CAMNT_0016372467 /DNA_START=504 /DNA_END=824 /DNA_ORIENTATION=-